MKDARTRAPTNEAGESDLRVRQHVRMMLQKVASLIGEKKSE